MISAIVRFGSFVEGDIYYYRVHDYDGYYLSTVRRHAVTITARRERECLLSSDWKKKEERKKKPMKTDK